MSDCILYSKRAWFVAAVLAVAMMLTQSLHAEIKRSIPQTLPSHPGNIFLAGESVTIPAPPGDATNWRMLDYANKVIAKGNIKDERVELGQLPIGYYKIVRGAPGLVTNRTYVGVLAPLKSPTPLTSPIGIDVAMAWFFPGSKEKMKEVCRLCELAGINRVRDRLLWPELEPQRGQFVSHTRYDDSADVQSAEGLQILQVGHVTAPWANTNMSHFPPDLRDVYNFNKVVAQRWAGKVTAFEPWNEADIKEFGGHTGSEMATLQKAAYWGLKSGNPKATACLNVFAIRRPETLADFYTNEAWPYYDTYNLHHYEPLQNYPALYADHRAVSGGKPMWVSECSVHVKWHGDEKQRELSDVDLRLQSERVTKTFVLGLHEGIQAMFYFMLPHYTEGKIQYGLLHADLTPRPGYVALAAVGRFLADAKPVGRVQGQGLNGYAFDAKTDGKHARVLVAWSDTGGSLQLPQVPLGCFDHLGRPIAVEGKTLNLTSAPVYVLLENGTKLNLVPPPAPAKPLQGKPAHIVLQVLFPERTIDFLKSAYKVDGTNTTTVPVYVYNFGNKTVRGSIGLDLPAGWSGDLQRNIEIAPGERKELTLKLNPAVAVSWTEASVRLRGNFGRRERPVFSCRLIAANSSQ